MMAMLQSKQQQHQLQQRGGSAAAAAQPRKGTLALFRLVFSAFAAIFSAGAILMDLRGHHHHFTSSSIISNSLCNSKMSSSSAALATTTVQLAPFPASHNNNNKNNINKKAANKNKEDSSSALTILQHELPGYTGWARPLYTLVDHFSVVGYSNKVATVGQDWHVTVECKHHEQCAHGGALFYIRAYGRSLLPGRVVDHENGRYTVTILPQDAGRYTLEVVLTISKKPNWEELPLKGKPGEPSYEGYLLPGFPLSFTVVEPPSPKTRVAKKKTSAAVQHAAVARHLNTDLPLCRARQLLETSTDSALATGRWLVVNKTRGLPYPRSAAALSLHNNNNNNDDKTNKTSSSSISFADTEQINIETYTSSMASVGFQMDYFHNDCNVLSLDEIADPNTWHTAIQASALDITDGSQQKGRGGGRLHVLFIGDSNTRNQYNFFRDFVAKPTQYMNDIIKHTYIDMMGHWPETFNHTRDMLYKLTSDQDSKNDHFFVVFNVGLHEVTNRCSINGLRKGLKLEGKCHEVYQKDVQELLDLIQQTLPHAIIKIWQSTTAGWPKWGLYGVGWPQHYGQKFPREPNFCGYINELAWPIVRSNNNNNNDVHVMDTYWLTLSRPDHREVVQKEAIRAFYKLVHLGPEVYGILVRKFVTIILEAVKNAKKPSVPYNLQ